ncbi:MAG: hypothetical protein OHK0022_60190 [Roseiflexaceae bacterium]
MIGLAVLAVGLLVNYVLTFALIRRLNSLIEQRSPDNLFLKPGQQAPDFSAQTLDGAAVTRSSYAGRPVTFVFFKSGCEPCREAIPSYEQARPLAERVGVELVLVSVEDAERTRAFVREQQISLPVLVAPASENTFQHDYQLPGTPAFCSLNERGLVQASGFASIDAEAWRTQVASWNTTTSRIPSPA